MAELPHFALPFRFATGAAVVAEQDTADEIMSCVLAVLLCPIGYRVEVPTFGIPDPTFTQAPLDTAPIDAALDAWEPRSHELADAWLDADDTLVSHVLVRIGAPTED